MNSLVNKIKSNKIILIILLSFVLNSIGIFYAYPTLRLVEDEVAIVSTVLKMINDFSLRPDFVDNYYPAPVAYIYLPFYLLYFAAFFLLGVVGSISELREMILLDYANFKVILPVARFISVLAGCLSVYLVYKISQVLFKKRGIALWSSFFTATSLIFIQLSHFGRIWIIQTLVVLLTIYCLARMLSLKKYDLKHYFISGLLIALSLGINLVGGVVYFCFLFVHYSLNKGKGFVKTFLKNQKFWLTNLVAFLSTLFIYFLHPATFHRYLGFYFKKEFAAGYISQSFSNSLSDSLNFAFYYIRVLWEYEPLLIILFLISLPLLFLKQKKAFYLLGIFALLYYLMIGPFLRRGCVRYILPIIPFLAIIAGYGFSCFLKKVSSRSLKNGLIIVFVLLFVLMPFYWNVSLLKPNTYVLAKQWAESNLASGESIINFELDNRLVLNENKESLTLMAEFMPGTVSARERYLLTLDEKEYSQPNYFIIYRPEKLPKDFLVKNQLNYLIIHWWNNQERIILEEKIAEFNYQLKLIQKFYPNQLKINLTDLVNDMRQPLQLLRNIRYTGPYIEIYEIINHNSNL